MTEFIVVIIWLLVVLGFVIILGSTIRYFIQHNGKILAYEPFQKWEIGHVYKVRRREVGYKRGFKDYYCTIINDPEASRLLTYIPNGFSRSLENYDGCGLTDRMTYIGTHNDYGHLLFDQDLGINPKNEYNTKFVFTRNKPIKEIKI